MRRPPNGKDGPLEGLVGLQADDDLVVAVDVAGLVREEGRGCLRIDGEHTLLSFLLEERLKLGPHGLGALGGAGEKPFISCVRGEVRWSRLSEQFLRIDKWSVCQG